MKIGVIGAGYVGLVVGAGLADAGHEVICTDSNSEKIHTLKMGHIPFFEPGLEDLIRTNKNRLNFTSDLKDLTDFADVFFLAVGTPENTDGSVDLRDLLHSIHELLRETRGQKTLVIKSTVPVGTAQRIRQMALDFPNVKLHIVSNPEFLRQGSAVEDFLKPDRLVFGVSDDRSEAIMRAVYEPILADTEAPAFFMDHASAELCKYAANSFLAMKISFINELAGLSEKLGADIDQVRTGFTSDHRIHPSFFHPGIGFGGSCFPKDLRALIHEGKSCGASTALLESALEVNENQCKHFVERLIQRLGSLDQKRIGILGLAFKPKTDDVRRAPSIKIIERLVSAGAQVQAFDPVAMRNAKKTCAVEFKECSSALEAAEGADALLLVTEWPEFSAIDLSQLKKAMRNPLVLDGRNLFDAQKLSSLGFEYMGIGKSPLGGQSIHS